MKFDRQMKGVCADAFQDDIILDGDDDVHFDDVMEMLERMYRAHVIPK